MATSPLYYQSRYLAHKALDKIHPTKPEPPQTMPYIRGEKSTRHKYLIVRLSHEFFGSLSACYILWFVEKIN